MKMHLIAFLAVPFIPALAAAQDQQTESLKILPPSIRAHLDKKYASWKFSPAAGNTIAHCDKESKSHPSAASGDFNGDGRADYAVKIIHGNKTLVLEFLSRDNTFSESLLFSGAANKLLGTALQVEKKGKPTIVGTVERVDALLISDCESIPLRYLFTNGRVRDVSPRD